MKGFVFAFALLAISASAFAEPPPKFKEFVEACKTELGITGDVSPLHDSEDPKAKCFSACLMKKMGKMADGKVVMEKEMEFATKIGMDDAKKEKLTDCVNKANTESDECEVAHAMGKCLKENDLIPTRPPHH